MLTSKDPHQHHRGNRPLTLLCASRVLALAFSLAVATFALAGTITVTTGVDELDLVPNGNCSLREAIVTVNEQRQLGVGGCSVVGTIGSNDTIVLPAGTYELSRVAAHLGLDADQDVDNLDVTRSVTIEGAGAAYTTIDATPMSDRRKAGGTRYVRLAGVFVIHSGTSVNISGVTITGGWAPNGGGIYNGGELSLTDVNVGRNVATLHGSGIENWGELTLMRVAIYENIGEVHHDGLNYTYGGGIYNRGILHATNVTISGNVAGTGGAIYTGTQNTTNGLTTLSSVTITDNEDRLESGGIVNHEEHTVRMENTILAGNRSGAAAADCSGSFDSRGYNLIGNSTGCQGFTDISDNKGSGAAPLDPLLTTLGKHGGQTPTHALLAQSPAIDRGPLQILDSCPATDQRGVPRANDGDDDGLLECDVGAYEAPEYQEPSANLEAQVTVAPNPVPVGGQVSYFVRAVNHGPDSAHEVSGTLEAPAGSGPWTSVPADCTASGSSVSCDFGSVAAGSAQFRELTAPAPATLGNVIATATVSAATTDPDQTNNEAQATVLVVGAETSDLALFVTGPTIVATNALVEYQLTAVNNGPQASDELTRVSAQIPAGASFESASVGCSVVSQQVTCLLGELQVATPTTANITLRAPTQRATLRLTATVLGAGGADGDLSNNNADWETEVMPPIPPEADLFLNLVGPSQAETGTEVEYTLLVASAGPNVADSVEVTTTFDPAVTITSLPTDCVESTADSSATCTVGTLPANGVRGLPIRVVGPAVPGELHVSSEVRNLGDAPDPDLSNNTAELVTTVRAEAPTPGADLALLKLAPQQVAPGATLRYQLVVTNTGPDAAEAVTLRDDLPATVTVTLLPAACSLEGTAVSCDLGTLAPNTSATTWIDVQAPATAGVVTNTAQVESVTTDPVTANNVSAVTTEVTVDAPPALPALTVRPGAGQAAASTAAPGDNGVTALRFSAEAGDSEGISLEAITVRLAGKGPMPPSATAPTLSVSWALLADAAAGTEVVSVLGSAPFTSASAVIEVDAAASRAATNLLPAGATGHYALLVDVGESNAALVSPTAPMGRLALWAVLFTPLALITRRLKVRLAIALIVGAALLSACRTVPQEAPDTYQLVVEAVTAQGAASGASAQVTGLPILGTSLTIERR